MNFLTNLGASIQFIAFAKEQVQSMHALIDAKQIPVEKSEDFFQQTAALERALGDQTYAQSLSRYNSAKRGLTIVAGVILAVALIVYGLSQFGPTSSMFKDITGPLLSDFVLFATTISIVAGLLLIGIVASGFYVRSLQIKLLGKDLSALWAKILQRWAPDLAAKQNIANIDPESVARIVAVQARIQDVDLNLK